MLQRAAHGQIVAYLLVRKVKGVCWIRPVKSVLRHSNNIRLQKPGFNPAVYLSLIFSSPSPFAWGQRVLFSARFQATLGVH